MQLLKIIFVMLLSVSLIFCTVACKKTDDSFSSSSSSLSSSVDSSILDDDDLLVNSSQTTSGPSSNTASKKDESKDQNSSKAETSSVSDDENFGSKTQAVSSVSSASSQNKPGSESLTDKTYSSSHGSTSHSASSTTSSAPSSSTASSEPTVSSAPTVSGQVSSTASTSSSSISSKPKPVVSSAPTVSSTPSSKPSVTSQTSSTTVSSAITSSETVSNKPSSSSSSTSSTNDHIWENGINPNDPSTYRVGMSMLTMTIGLSKQAVLHLIDELSASGIDAFMFGVGGDVILDDMSITTKYGTYSLNAFLEGRRFTQKDVDEIIAYAQTKDVEIIPVLQTPGHMTPFLRNHPEWKYPGTNDSLDLTNPEATAYMHAAYKKYGEYFASRGCKYFSVSADEWGHAFNALGYDKLYKNGEMGYFVDYMNKNIEILSDLGFEVMAWNDGICYNNDVTTYGKIDNRLIVLYWSPGWYGNKFATPEFLESQGYRVVNSYHTYYIDSSSDLLERENKIRQFNYTIGEYELKDPFGGMICVWARPRDNDGGITTVNSLIAIFDAFMEGINFYKIPVKK